MNKTNSIDDIELRFQRYRQKKRREELQREKFRRLYKNFMKKVREREACNVNILDVAECVLQKDLENAFKILEGIPESKKRKQKPTCLTVIRENLIHRDLEEPKTLWYLPTYIPQFLRSSILTQDWDNVTHLLLLLLEHKPMYLAYLKKIAFLDFLKNPSDADARVLEEFLQLCFVKIKPTPSPPSFDICYKEILE